MENYENKKLDWIWYLSVFLFSLNFLNKEYLFIVITIIFGLFLGFYKKTYKGINLDFLLLILFSVFYYFTLIRYNTSNVVMFLLYLMGPGACFFSGYIVVKSLNEKFIIKTIYFIVFGNFLYGFLNMIMYSRYFGLSSTQRRVPDFWSGIDIAATLQGTHFTPLVSLVFFSFLLWRINGYTRILAAMSIVAIFISLYSSFIIGNRTLIVISVFIVSLNAIIYIIYYRIKIYKVINMLYFLCLFISLLIGGYIYNFGGIRIKMENSQLFLRTNEFSFSEDPRFLVYGKVLKQMFKYPFGGYKMDIGLNYAHNLWLDVLYSTGIIPFFLLATFTFLCIKNIVYILKKGNINKLFIFLIFSIYVGYLLNFMVEPILEGVPYMFLSFCLLNGMVKKYFDLIKNSERGI